MAAHDPTLLLQDLLSPPSSSAPPADLLRLAAYHLATVPLAAPHLALVSLVARYTAASPAIWAAPAKEARDEWDRHVLAFQSAQQAVLLRLDTLARPPTPADTAGSGSASAGTSRGSHGASGGKGGGGGWSGRRAAQTFLRELLDGLSAGDDNGSEWPLVRLAMVSGVLSALQEWKRRKEKLWVGGRNGVERAQREVAKAWDEVLKRGPAEHGSAMAHLPAWLAAQTIPSVHVEVLAMEWPAAVLLNLLTDSFAAVFAHGNAFTEPPLAADVNVTGEGLAWASGSPSHQRISALVQQPLFVVLGPLSRALGRSLEATAQTARSSATAQAESSLAAIHRFSTSLVALASSLNSGWSTTPWADLTGDDGLAPTTRAETAPWTLLKTLLFAQTLVYSSLLEVVTSSSTSSSTPTPLQRQLASEAVRALAKTYFVALRFGQSGFEAWRAVLAGLVDVAAAPALAGAEVSPAEALVRALEAPKGTANGVGHASAMQRAEVTFWMNTAEQVMLELGDEYVETRVLRGCRPYLDDAMYRDTFEAAHAVVLAVFSAGKRCVAEVAPWYIALLPRIYPSLLSASQLRLAYSTTVGAVSKTEDALAWWCIEELLAQIEALPVATLSVVPEAPVRPPLRDLAEDTPPSSIADVNSASPVEATDVNPATPVSPLETRALTLPRGAYLLVLPSLLPAVNLVLFSPLLTHLERLIRLEPIGHDGRNALVESTFEMLGVGMDAVKRAEGTEWWLKHGKGLMRGGPLDDEDDAEREEEQDKEGEQEERRNVTEALSAKL